MHLIRMIRSAIRFTGRVLNRLFRITFKAALVIVVISMITYAALNIWYYTGEVKITRDVVAELTATARNAPPEDRAWPLYREAMQVITPPSFKKNPPLNPEHPEWDSFVESNERNRELIELLRQGAGKPYLGFVSGEPFEGPGLRSDRNGEWEADWARKGVIGASELMLASTPAMPVCRSICRVLVVDAAIAESLGDGERLTDDIVAILRLADQCHEIPLMINDLTSVSIYVWGRQLIDDALHRSPDIFFDAHLDRLEAALLDYMDGDIRGRVDLERAVLDDYIQRSFTDNGKGSGHVIRPPHDRRLALSDPGSRWSQAKFPRSDRAALHAVARASRSGFRRSLPRRQRSPGSTV